MLQLPVNGQPLALSDLLKLESDLQAEVEHTEGMKEQLLQRFYLQMSALEKRKAAAVEQLRSVQEEAREKLRLAQLLQFPPQLSRFAHLVTPQSECEDGSDPKLLVSFGTARLDRTATAYIDALAKAVSMDKGLRTRGVSLTAIIDPGSGRAVMRSSDNILSGTDHRHHQRFHSDPSLGVTDGTITFPGGAAILSHHHPDSVSPQQQVSHEELIAFERAIETMPITVSCPRVEKMTQPFVLADASYIPYLQQYDEKTLQERIKNRTHRFLRRFNSAEWVASNAVHGAVDHTTLQLRLKRNALSDFVVMKCTKSGRTLCSVRPHSLGELLFVDVAALSVADDVEDLLLTPDLRKSYDLIHSKNDLFTKYKSWDIRLVLFVFSFICQQANSAPAARRSKRNTSAVSYSNVFAKTDVKRKIAALCCPVEEMEPSTLNELYKLAQVIHAALPLCFQRGEDEAEVEAAPGDTEPPPLTLTIEEIVRLMVIFQCNSVNHSQGGAPLPSKFAQTTSHPSGRSLFFTVSLIEHSCVPNSAITHKHTLVDPETGSVEADVRGLRATKAGERLTISYVNAYLPAAVARRKLRDRYYFECQCPRCCGDVPDFVRAVLVVPAASTNASTSRTDEGNVRCLLPFGVGGHWLSKDGTGRTADQLLRYDDPLVIESVALEDRLGTSSQLAAAWTAISHSEASGEEEMPVLLQRRTAALEVECERLYGLISDIVQHQPIVTAAATSPLPSPSAGQGRALYRGVAVCPPLERFLKHHQLIPSTTNDSSTATTPSTSSGTSAETGERLLPAMQHYTVVVAMLFMCRAAETLLVAATASNVAASVGEEIVAKIVNVASKCLQLMVHFATDFSAAVGLHRLTLDSTSARASVTVEQQPHHFATVAAAWELAAGLATRLEHMSGSPPQSHTVAAKACWETAVAIYRVHLHWADTSRCIKGQLFAADPQRYVDCPPPSPTQHHHHQDHHPSAPHLFLPPQL